MATAYSAIADSEIDTDSPITASLMTRVRNNPIAIAEGAATAPRVAIDLTPSGAGSPQTALGTDITDTNKYIRANGAGGCEMYAPRAGGGQYGTEKQAGLFFWRPDTAMTLENMTQVVPSDGWGTGLRCDVAQPRATQIGMITGVVPTNVGLAFYEDNGVALTTLLTYSNGVIKYGFQWSCPLVAGRVYIMEVDGALAYQPDDIMFTITN